jgi:DNA-binding Lrp family transcriptional regulator
MRKQRGLDRTDELMLGLLRENARASNTEIAQRLNVSESAVRRRIVNLVKSGRIRKFTVDVEDEDVSSAITWVSVSPATPTGQVSAKMKEVRGVEVVYETAGQFDIAALITGANIVEVNKTVEGIRRIQGVINTNTAMVLRSIR